METQVRNYTKTLGQHKEIGNHPCWQHMSLINSKKLYYTEIYTTVEELWIRQIRLTVIQRLQVFGTQRRLVKRIHKRCLYSTMEKRTQKNGKGNMKE